jgi:RNA polymerase sigma-70 factor (ECF subfamily)
MRIDGLEAEGYLIKRAVQRDREAFTSLYSLFVKRVYAHAYYSLSNKVDAEDITQEVFIRAWKGIDKYKASGAPFIAWLLKISNNLIIDRNRSTKPITYVEDLNDLDNHPISPESQVEIKFEQLRIREAISKLKGDKQKIIVLRYIDGYKIEEIAKMLNCSQGAIRITQYRALIELRKTLNEKSLEK